MEHIHASATLTRLTIYYSYLIVSCLERSSLFDIQRHEYSQEIH